MNIAELKKRLSEHPESTVRFTLPNGETIPAHAHVTEVARIDKHFVDCGGTVREESMCRLQTWVADDRDHRLNAGKLLRILEKAKPLLKSDELEADVEYEVGYISQFPVERVEARGSELIVKLTERHTACLAMDECCPPAAGEQCCAPASPLAEFKPLNFSPVER
jgi:hypothetical protein